MRSRKSRVSTGVACLLAVVVLFSGGALRAEDATAQIDNFTFLLTPKPILEFNPDVVF